MLQVILVVITISAGGDKKMTGIGFESIEGCYGAASLFLETVAADFENLGMREVSAACLIRPFPKPA